MILRPTGSARRGLGEWLAQRLTALYMGGLGMVAVIYLLLVPVPNYLQWKAWLAGIAVRVALSLFFASALVHAWVGLRSIYMDYLKPLWLRVTVTAVTLVILLALGLWTGHILLWGFPP